MRLDVNSADIQALAKTAFSALKGATYLMLRVESPQAARRWLDALKPASVADLASARPLEATQVAITAAGLRALGVASETIARFSPEFVEGMSGSPNRSQRLGDIGANAPQYWEWGVGEREPHVLLMLLSAPERMAELEADARRAAEESGLRAIAALPTNDMEGVEPFGFRDGVSQPAFDWDKARTPGTKADGQYTNLVALGEILLGYRNEYGFLAESPTVARHERNADLLPVAAGPGGARDLGRNGSYLVFRQLAQDVRSFWRWTASEAARSGTDIKSLAEAMVGRRMNGAPLIDIETGLAVQGVSERERAVNGFLFDADPDGLSCPLGSHVRRANPRTADIPAGVDGPIDRLLVMLGLATRRLKKPTSSTLPWEKNTTVWPYIRHEDDSVASVRFHRILRRGREYGERIGFDEALDPNRPDPKAGLHFLCLNSNINRQFEFVQGAWIMNSKFAALTGEQDPLIGNRQPFPVPPISPAPQRTDGFTRPGAEPQRRRSTGVPQFVTVRGGAYFFLPGLKALKWIASGCDATCNA